MGRQVKFLMFILLTAWLFIPFAGVGAQTNCDSLVSDEAEIFKSGFSNVETAAKNLERLGVDVRVRTYASFGSAGNLDAYEKQIESQCTSWRGADGNRKNNLVVVMISINERKTGIYYGDQWDAALDNQWLRVQSDFMNPAFRRGDFAGGFIAGMNEIGRLIDLYLHPRQNPAPAPIVVQPSEPMDLSGLWSVLTLLLSLAATVCGLYFAYIFIRAYFKRKEEKRIARQRALLAKQGAAARINELNELWPFLDAKVSTTVNSLKDKVAIEAKHYLDEFKRLLDNATVNFANLEQPAGDPSHTNLSTAEYTAIATSYENILKQLGETILAQNEIETRLDQLAALIEEVPKYIAEAETAINQSASAIAAVASSGFKANSATKKLDAAARALAQAKELLENKNLTEAKQDALDAIAHAHSAEENANHLPKYKAEFDEEAQKLETKITDVSSAIENGASIFARISAQYAESCWESIRGNGTEATKRVGSATELLATLRKTSSMNEQDWSTSRKIINEAFNYLHQAESYMRSVVALEINLAEAKNNASDEIETAGADIARAWDYIHRYDDDIRESLESDLRSAEKVVAKATDELSKSKPDYLRVVKWAREANASADKILDEARDEHETMERKRAKAASLLRDATSAVSRAKEYIEDHNNDVGQSARNQLNNAIRYLAMLQAATTLDDIINAGEHCEQNAESAYEQAKNDFYQAERAREAAERAREAQEAAERRRRDSYSSSTSYGGGSSSWGSGSSGGGGSSSWGSNGGGGGGSSGW